MLPESVDPLLAFGAKFGIVAIISADPLLGNWQRLDDDDDFRNSAEDELPDVLAIIGVDDGDVE